MTELNATQIRTVVNEIDYLHMTLNQITKLIDDLQMRQKRTRTQLVEIINEMEAKEHGDSGGL